MIIPLKVALHGTNGLTLPPQIAKFGSDELVLIELQGTLDVEGQMEGQFVGKLNIDSETGKPSLLIGHHLLEGKLVELPKPIAVMNRAAHTPSDTDTNVYEVEESTNAPPRWDIVAIVKRKMVFAKRPMPMVGLASHTTTTK